MPDAVAVLGLGAMGGPMVRRLLNTDREVTVYDPDSERVAASVRHGARAARRPRDAAAAARYLILMVATADQAETALFGADGAVEGLAPGTTVVLMSTVGPGAVQAIHERLATVDVAVVDAPVSGGVARAGDGHLLIMAACSVGVWSHAKSLLEDLGTTVVRVGDAPGDGQRIKLVNQLLCGVHIAAAAEAMAFAETLGLDTAAAWDVIRRGAAASFMLDDRGGRMVAGEFSPVQSAVNIFVKDLSLVQDAAHERSIPLMLASAAQAMFVHASQLGLGDHDDSELVLTIGHRSE